jgi:hypothetical protein
MRAVDAQTAAEARGRAGAVGRTAVRRSAGLRLVTTLVAVILALIFAFAAFTLWKKAQQGSEPQPPTPPAYEPPERQPAYEPPPPAPEEPEHGEGAYDIEPITEQEAAAAISPKAAKETISELRAMMQRQRSFVTEMENMLVMERERLTEERAWVDQQRTDAEAKAQQLTDKETEILKRQEELEAREVDLGQRADDLGSDKARADAEHKKRMDELDRRARSLEEEQKRHAQRLEGERAKHEDERRAAREELDRLRNDLSDQEGDLDRRSAGVAADRNSPVTATAFQPLTRSPSTRPR